MQITTSTLRSGLTSVLLITSIAALCGCGKGPDATVPPPATPSATPSATPAVVQIREHPPSDAEAQAFATSFEKTLASGNTAAINAAIDADSLLRRVMAGIDLAEDVRQRFVVNLKADLSRQEVSHRGSPDRLREGVIIGYCTSTARARNNGPSFAGLQPMTE